MSLTSLTSVVALARHRGFSISLVLALAACAGDAAEGDPGPDPGPDDPAPGDPSPGQGDELPACAPADDHLECAYKKAGDLTLDADVYGADEAAPGEARPALLWIHGGALIFGHRIELADADEQLDLYLDRGYVVVSIDYRLAPATRLDQIQADVSDAYDWLRREGPSALGIDPDRIGVVGHSAGAYLALSLGFRADPRPRALVSFYGYGTLGWYTQPSPVYLEDGAIDDDDPDVEAVRSGPPIANSSLDELDQRITFYVYCRQTGRWPIEVAGHDPAREASFFADHEPLRHVDADYPPTMLLHGQEDEDVPFGEAQAMFDALEASGVDAAFVHDGLARYEGAAFGHGFDEDMDAPGVRMAFGEALDFLDRNVQDSP
jgi:acetyl esterase/lipase